MKLAKLKKNMRSLFESCLLAEASKGHLRMKNNAVNNGVKTFYFSRQEISVYHWQSWNYFCKAGWS